MRRLAVLLATLLLLAGCTEEQGTNVDPELVDSVVAPEDGACRVLTPTDITMASNATRTVDCTEPHTAQTYEVGDLPEELADAAYDDPQLGDFAYRTCGEQFRRGVRRPAAR